MATPDIFADLAFVIDLGNGSPHAAVTKELAETVRLFGGILEPSLSAAARCDVLVCTHTQQSCAVEAVRRFPAAVLVGPRWLVDCVQRRPAALLPTASYEPHPGPCIPGFDTLKFTTTGFKGFQRKWAEYLVASSGAAYNSELVRLVPGGNRQQPTSHILARDFSDSPKLKIARCATHASCYLTCHACLAPAFT